MTSNTTPIHVLIYHTFFSRCLSVVVGHCIIHIVKFVLNDDNDDTLNISEKDGDYHDVMMMVCVCVVCVCACNNDIR